MDDLEALIRRTSRLYGSEDFSIFLYSIVKMSQPRVAVELGTGSGQTSLQIAKGMKENRRGRLYSFDSGEHFENFSKLKERLQSSKKNHPKLPIDSYKNYLRYLRNYFGFQNYVVYKKLKIEVNDSFYFLDRFESIDLFFSDFNHHPNTILKLLGKVLPKMELGGNVFLDCSSLNFGSNLMINTIIQKLNRRIIPAGFVENTAERASLARKLKRISFQIINICEEKQRKQNNTTWIKIIARNPLGVDFKKIKKI